MNDFKFVSEKYSIQNTENYRLSIQVNPDGFSLLMLDDEEKVITIIHRQTGSVKNTQKLFKQEEDFIKFRELSFRSFSLLINSNRVSLAPAEIEMDPGLLMNLEFDSVVKDGIRKREIQDKKLSYHFEIDNDLNSLLSDFRNSPKPEHLCGFFIDYIFSFHNSEDDSCYIYSTPCILHIARIEHNKLHKYNAYNGTNDEELLYHFVNTLHKLHIKNNTNVFYSGHIVKADEFWKVMERYHKNIEILPNEFDFELAGNINENYFSYLLRSLSENNQR